MSAPCEKHASLPVVGHSACAGCEIERLKAIVKVQAGRIDILCDELNSSRKQVDTLSECYANSMIEREAMRRDAERYRWTSIDGNWVARMFGKWRAHIGAYGDANPTDWYPSREEAIDAAMSKDPLADKGQ